MLKIDWAQDKTVHTICPVCALAADRKVFLTVHHAVPGFPPDPICVYQCDGCTAKFVSPVDTVEYSTADERGLVYYLQSGAGIDVMLQPLTLLDRRPVKTLLEIGCSFGFFLDYARRQLGWDVHGYDPGNSARIGKKLLDLPIENEYFSQDSGYEKAVDVFFCSEVIEHISEPDMLMSRIIYALKNDGVLLLTTPNGELLRPDVTLEWVLPILSASQHVIFYTPRALEVLCRKYGLPHIRVETDGIQIRLAASAKPFDGQADYFNRAAYRDYLHKVRANQDPASDLGNGLEFRAFKELVNAGDFIGGEKAFHSLAQTYRSRYKIDLLKPDTLVFPTASLPIEEFGANWPFNLAEVLYFGGIIEFLKNGPSAIAASMFAASARFAPFVLAALRREGATSLETANIARESALTRLRVLAAIDPDQAVVEFQSLKNPTLEADVAEHGKLMNRAREILAADLINHSRIQQAKLVLGDRPLTPIVIEQANDLQLALAQSLFLLRGRSDVPSVMALFDQAIRFVVQHPESAESFAHLANVILPEISVIDPVHARRLREHIDQRISVSLDSELVGTIKRLVRNIFTDQ